MKKTFREIVALMLVAGLTAAGTGCGNTVKPDDSTVTQDTGDTETVTSDNATSVSSSSEQPQTVRVKITDNGKPIADFDEFVNGEWKKEQEDIGSDMVLPTYDEGNDLWNGISDILKKTDKEKLSEDDGIYKLVTMYSEIADSADASERLETMREYLATIEKVQTLDDLYDLYRNERYYVMNDILKFAVDPNDGGYVVLIWSPSYPWRESQSPPTEDEAGAGILFYQVMEDLGYSKDETRGIAENALKVADKIDECWKKMEQQERIYCMTKAKCKEEGVTFPVIEILGDQYAEFCPKGFNPKLDGFWSAIDCVEFFNELYVSENMQMLKDFHLACAVYYLGIVADMPRYEQFYGIDHNMIAEAYLRKRAEELLVSEYAGRNVKSETIEQCEEMMEEVKLSLRTIIDEAQWLGLHGKEQAKSKVLRIRVSYSGDTAVNDFSDIELTGNTLEDYISMYVSADHFLKSQTALEDEAREIFGMNDYDINAHYNGEYNAVVFTTGMIEYFQNAGDMSYEERLGLVGYTMAHELGHAYDAEGSQYNSKGWNEPWMTDEELAAYNEKTQKIAEFFDGRKTEYDKTIDGELIMNETFADLMAMECCLRILAQKEDPDYDAFFRSYARNRTAYYTEEGMENALKDSHLPGKDRVNLVLAQFDKFYEIYDIDENSPYFVKEEDRLPVF